MIATIDNITFRVELDVIDDTRTVVEDPNWDFCDDEGHVHKWYVSTKDSRVDIPSCIRVTDVPSTEFHPGLWHWECRDCGQDVEPGYYQPGRQLAAGLTSFFINDREVSEEEYRICVEEVLNQ